MDLERPAKRAKLLSDDEDSGDDSSSSGGVPIKLGINEEYAKRFEHNKKRAEQHKLEEKYGKSGGIGSNGVGNGDGDEDSEESSDEDEDEEAELAKGVLDDEFQATLKALKSRDPRIYDKQQKFYSTDPDAAENVDEPETKEKPLYLSDYHRKNLLNGNYGGEESTSGQPTYAEEQEDIRKSFLNAADQDQEKDDESGGEGDFLARKQILEPEGDVATDVKMTEEIRKGARDDPDRFLSNFMDSKGWLPTTGSKLQAFESDDEDFDDMQDQFEHNYNMRFEIQDTKGKIQGFARDIASEYSVRKDATNKRQRARDLERQKKEEEKQQRSEEKARLRKLKLEEAEKKLKQVKAAAGTSGKDFDMEQWSSLLTGDWDDNEWQKKFEEKFGDTYYAAEDQASDDQQEAGTKRKKPKKPKFDDDIDITDLVPDFEEEQTFSITDEEDDDAPAKKKKGKKDHKKEREDAKREARKERRKLEAMVSEKLDSDLAMSKASSAKPSGLAPFRYRETSPTNFGLTPSEILMASDTQLNQFAGLKKLAAFRDEGKKRKDRKHLGKKARLRKWRKETFGNEQGPQKTLQDVLRDED